MRMISPRSQHAALLGGLLLAASLLAVSQSLADTFPPNQEFLSVTPGNPRPGPAGSPRTAGRGQLLLQLRRSSGEVYGEEWGRHLAPVLAQMDEIDGVESSSSNRRGALLKLALKPGADPAKVAQEAERVLIAQFEDRVPVPLAGKVAVAAAEGQEWWDHSQVAELLAAAEIAPPVRQPSMALPLLLLWWLIVALGLCWWQRRRMLAAARQKALLAWSLLWPG